MAMRSQTLQREEDELAVELEPIEEGSQHILAPSRAACEMREMRAERDRRRWLIGGAAAAVAVLALVGIAGAWMWGAARADRQQESTDDLSQVALKYKRHAKKKEASEKAVGGVCSKAFEQCGGSGYDNSTCCESGCICETTNEFYSQCSPPEKAATCDPALAKSKLDNWTKQAEIAQKLADNATGHLGWLEEQVNKLTGSSEWWTKKAAKSADEMGHLQWEMDEAAKKAAGNFSVEDGCSEATKKCSGEGGCCQKGCSCVDMGSWSQCQAASKGGSCWASVRDEGKAEHAQKVKEFEAAKATADKDAAELETRNKDLEKFRAEKELAEKDAEEKNAKSKKYNEKVRKWKEAFEGEAKAKEAAAKAEADSAAKTKKQHEEAAGKKEKTAKKAAGHKKDDDDDEEEEEEEEEDVPKVEADEEERDESEDEASLDDEDEADGVEEEEEVDVEEEEDGDDEKEGHHKDDDEEDDAGSDEKDGKSKKDEIDEEEDDDWEDEEYGDEDE